MSLVGSSESLVLSFVSGVWMDQSFPLKPSYQHLVQGLYKAQANTVDFQHRADEVKDEINRWAENETKGLIEDLVSRLSGDLRIVLANALSFKGTWERMFDVSRTRNRDFHQLDGEKVSVPFMTSAYSQFFGSFDGFKLVKIPYQKGEDGRQFSMYIFLPNERDGLQNLVQELESNHWFLHQLSNLRKVQLSAFLIPKFKFSYDFESEAIIKGLGLTRPFEPRGELTEISTCSDNKFLHFSKVIQNCYIEVNEEGTEAAAATITGLTGCSRYSVPPPKPTFVADHPFVFMIMEETSDSLEL
ncbi:serpin-ZX-like [Cornus florida]|uniref:serpin-ZX-like n=1 Tax=Cornus florida TaxID=4283 RepID=UPI00289FB930|nr:serpin-ZX-like [Cornus florida]